MTTPACANDHCTSPEQSNAVGPAAPHTYGMPTRLRAALRKAAAWAGLSRPPVAADPAVAGLPPVARLAGVTSISTAAPAGTAALILDLRVDRRAPGALITMALPAGNPSERATAWETTASTPGMPTVPSPPTWSVSGVCPATFTVLPVGSLASRPIV